MSVGTAAAIAIGTGVSAAGAIGGAALSSSAAGHAADIQANAANRAADLQHQDQQASLDFQKKEWDTQQQNIAPWLKAGQGAVTSLSDMLKNGGFPNWTDTFQAPTNVTEQNDPGYKFRLDQGMQALENSAAARGGALTSGAGKDLERYAQDYASNEYGNVYNRAYNEYSTRFNQFQANQNNVWNRYASLAGMGQNATNTLAAGSAAASRNVANINLTSGEQIAGQMNNAAFQRASGYTAAANAWSGALGNISGLSQLTLQQLLKNTGSSPPAFG